jgi:hypothetical protein
MPFCLDVSIIPLMHHGERVERSVSAGGASSRDDVLDGRDRPYRIWPSFRTLLGSSTTRPPVYATLINSHHLAAVLITQGYGCATPGSLIAHSCGG